MKTFKQHINEVKFFTADQRDKYVSDEIKKRKLARFPVNATDDYKMKKGKPTFTFPTPTGSMVIKVWLRPMPKPAKSHFFLFLGRPNRKCRSIFCFWNNLVGYQSIN